MHKLSFTVSYRTIRLLSDSSLLSLVTLISLRVNTLQEYYATKLYGASASIGCKTYFVYELKFFWRNGDNAKAVSRRRQNEEKTNSVAR